MTFRVLAASVALAAIACAGPQQRPWSGAEYCHLDLASAPDEGEVAWATWPDTAQVVLTQ